mgnify:CR=1 FL=1
MNLGLRDRWQSLSIDTQDKITTVGLLTSLVIFWVFFVHLSGAGWIFGTLALIGLLTCIVASALWMMQGHSTD